MSFRNIKFEQNILQIEQLDARPGNFHTFEEVLKINS